MLISPHHALDAFAQPPLIHRGLPGLPYPEDRIEPWLVRLCVVLERLRRAFGGREVVVLSGYRSPLYNLATGHKEAQDEHAQGRAADVLVAGVAPDDVVVQLFDLVEHERELPIGGVHRHRGYTHIDVRPLRRRMPAYREDEGLPALPVAAKPTLCLGCGFPVNQCRCLELQVIKPEGR